MDEEFYGVITPLAIPREFLNLVKEIEDYQEKATKAGSGIYQSESFGGYSYTLATNKNGNIYKLFLSN